MSAAFDELRVVGLSVSRACELVGRSRATHYRQARPPLHGPVEARQVPDSGQALTAQERTAVLEMINQQVYADLSIGQIWARELDADNYICSMSSMYRIARAAGQTRERRRQATHPPKVKPELMADTPRRCGPGTSPSCAARPRASGSTCT
jgi:hypothetical protein